MRDLVAYFLVVTAISCSMFAAMYFDKKGERLCAQEAVKYNYSVKDVAKMCGISYVSLGDKE